MESIFYHLKYNEQGGLVSVNKMEHEPITVKSKLVNDWIKNKIEEIESLSQTNNE